MKIIKMLLKKKDIEIDFKNKDGYTPLMIASYKGNTDIVKLLYICMYLWQSRCSKNSS